MLTTSEATSPPAAPSGRKTARLALVVGALGVVFGDIGTSPIYTVQTIFNPGDPHPVPLTTDNIYGVVSLIFWSVMIIVTLTYVTLVMHADNDGEGGVMALIALVRRWGSRSGRTAVVLATLGLFGAALFSGDSMITPAISVLSAVEGLKVVNRDCRTGSFRLPPSSSLRYSRCSAAERASWVGFSGR
jgi:KUP system potassium uptake protein